MSTTFRQQFEAALRKRARPPDPQDDAGPEVRQDPEPANIDPPEQYSTPVKGLTLSTVANVYASTHIERLALTWDEIVAWLREPKEQPSKDACALLKLATFGDKRNKKGSLRHDENVVEVFGIELDHDAETMTLDEAAALLDAAGIRGFLYTSASHCVVNPPKSRGGPRWRGVFPLSQGCEPGRREHYVSVINGVLGGGSVLSPESWALSQIYYFGKVKGVTYDTRNIEGACIDELEALGVLPEPIGKPRTAPPAPAAVPADIPELLGEAMTPKWEKLNLPERVRQFLSGKYDGADRSGELQYITAVLYEFTSADGNLHDDIVLSMLATNPTAMGVALEHRSDDQDAALEYLWKHHCVPAKTKADRSTSSSAEFEDLAEKASAPAEPASGNPLLGYYAYLPQHMFIHRATRQLFPGPSVDGHLKAMNIGAKPTAWLDQHRAVHQITWDPNRGEIIEGEVVDGGGWIRSPGQSVYNSYRKPIIRHGDPTKAGPWLEHVQAIFPGEWEHLVKWFAQRLQHPGCKCNHALVLGGEQGIGKDFTLEPVKDGVGRWNWTEVTPEQMLGRFNGFAQSVVVRINEARDLGESDRFKVYDHTKQYIAAPPDVLMVDEKHRREFPVINVMGVVITTNHKTDGIYLPADDRRHYVAWSNVPKVDFSEAYWNERWSWLYEEGLGHVAAYLRAMDLRGFDPKAPPPRTEAWEAIVMAGQDPDDDGLDDVLEAMGRPSAVMMSQVRWHADQPDMGASMIGGDYGRRFLHMMGRAGYSPIRNPDNKRGRWRIGEAWTLIFARNDLQTRERYEAARELLRTDRTSA